MSSRHSHTRRASLTTWSDASIVRKGGRIEVRVARRARTESSCIPTSAVKGAATSSVSSFEWPPLEGPLGHLLDAPSPSPSAVGCCPSPPTAAPLLIARGSTLAPERKRAIDVCVCAAPEVAAAAAAESAAEPRFGR
eukprot:5779137-Pleurochrysis_carterae.AAC.2